MPVETVPAKPSAILASANSGGAHSASDHVSHQASQLYALIEDIAKTAPEAAKEKLENLKQGVTKFCEHGKDRAGEFACKVKDTIKAHPMKSAAAAVGAGLLTWWLLTRRR